MGRIITTPATNQNQDVCNSNSAISIDTNQLQEVTAEIEDREGVTHKVEVLVKWDADFLVGKEVSTSTSDDGATLSLVS